MHKNVLIYVLIAAVADFDKQGLPRTVRRTLFDAATSILTSKCGYGLIWSANSLASTVGRLSDRDSDGKVFSGFKRPRRRLTWQDRQFMSWSWDKRNTAELFHLEVDVPTPMSSHDFRPLQPRLSTIFCLNPSSVPPMAIDETFLLSM